MSIATRAAAVLLSAALFGGCATISHGTMQSLDVRSQPVGAAVSTSLGIGCITPCTLTFKRKAGFVATIRKQGYRPIEVIVSSVDTAHRGAVARSALTTGLVGYLVDRGNGALRELRPNPIDVTLTPDAPPAH